MSFTPDIVIIGLTITSSWGNGHATTYRSLVKALHAQGHTILFLEKDEVWYKNNRDFNGAPYVNIEYFTSFDDLKDRFSYMILKADLVIVGSYVPEGIRIGDWLTKHSTGITAFYDIDTPVTISHVNKNSCTYLNIELISQYSLYLTFAGGPIPEILQNVYGAQLARPLYCSVDPDIYFPEAQSFSYDLGYMGTYCDDRQASLEQLMFEPSRIYRQGKFIVAGPMYPQFPEWPDNIVHVNHIPPAQHRSFYCSQRFTLNLTRADMILSGYAPSVRLFEAAACGTPVISDCWPGLEKFFTFNDEILISTNAKDTIQFLTNINNVEREKIAANARKKILLYHTSDHRAQELDFYLHEVRQSKKKRYSLSFNIPSKQYVQLE